MRPLKTTDFDWVITVPAIWDARGKRMMREAAYLVSYISIFVAINCQLILQAGLLNESGGIDLFTTLSYHSLPLPKEINPDKLSLALEPESAALYSQEMVTKHIASDASATAISRPTDYMVIDIGGGTVDITAHVEVDGGIVVEKMPSGNGWGGTQVNEAFSNLLQKLVKDSNFEGFFSSYPDDESRTNLSEMLYHTFEDEKVSYGEFMDMECHFISVHIPDTFYSFYKKKLHENATTSPGLNFDSSRLDIEEEVVECQLFGPALDGIIKCTLEAIEEIKYKVDTFYLVGGFGGCQYVYEKVKAAIERVYSSKGRSCTVLVPSCPHLAVVLGAVMWRKNPEKIKERRSDATYGTAMNDVFDPKEHDEHYKYYNAEQGVYKCRDIFRVFLEKGELVNFESVKTKVFIPESQTNEQMSIALYGTQKLGVKYVKDKYEDASAIKIGEILIDIPNPDNLPRKEREVEVTMDFSGTEIQAKAKYRVTGEEVTTVCDFLCAY